MLLKRNRALIFIFLCFFLGTHSGLQAAGKNDNARELRIMEDSLIMTADSMFHTPIPDFRTGYCEQFVRQLIRTLKTPGSYNYPFDSLRKLINIISPEDKSFRIFNWAIAYSDVRLRYYAAIQMSGEELRLFPLYDNSDMLNGIDDSKVLTNREWIGGLFYNIITRKVDGRDVYCLLGLNDGNPVSTKKFIDPMIFTDKGPEFGAPVFAIPSASAPGSGAQRFVLEYKKGVQVSMNWDDTHGGILFDDIASQVNDPNRKYTYIPTGQYNALRWSGNAWHLVRDVIPLLELKDGEAPSGDDKK
jgi:hypothetical protein